MSDEPEDSLEIDIDDNLYALLMSLKTPDETISGVIRRLVDNHEKAFKRDGNDRSGKSG